MTIRTPPPSPSSQPGEENRRLRPTRWPLALSLRERAAGRCRAEQGQAGEAPAPTPDGEELFARWRRQEPFPVKELFTSRLEADGLDEAGFLSLLSLDPEVLADDHRPTWNRRWLDALSTPPEPSALPEIELPQTLEGRPFLAWLEPLVAAVHQELLRRRPDEATHKLAPQLLSRLAYRLVLMVSRTLTLELHISRLEERLSGETAEERFESFVEGLRTPEVAERLLADYPVLARLLAEEAERWLLSTAELLNHLEEDAERLEAASGKPLGAVVHVRTGAGDAHRGGKTVAIVTFAAGDRWVYKPRSLAVDARFGELVAWLNEGGLEPPLQVPRVIDRGDHGWVEFLEVAGCSSAAEVRRFYQRLGAYLALLYALDGTDVHFENLIAQGEHPFLVDLETLFHPALDDDSGELRAGAGSPERRDPMHRTVLASGLLPQRNWGDAGRREGVDMSGMGAATGAPTPHAMLGVDEAGTDGMRYVRRLARFGDMHHRPRLEDREVRAVDYLPDVQTGFERLYTLLLRRRDELLAPAGPLAAFDECEVRVILRPTWTYALLLQESFHPDVLQDALERDLLFDRLWAGVPMAPHLAELVAYEQRDLAGMDIPLFSARIGSRSLQTSTGDRLANFFLQAPIDQVEDKIRLLCREDLQRQLWLMERSLKSAGIAAGAPRPRYLHRPSERPASPEQLREAANRVAERFGVLAFSGPRGEAHWFTTRALGRQRVSWSVEAMGPDLYDGLPGVALFLAYHGSELSTDLSRRAWALVERQLERRTDPVGVGGFTGLGGVLYAASHLAQLWGDPRLFECCDRVVAELGELIPLDEEHDLIGGAAGCLLALLALHHVQPSPGVLDLAVRCGDHLRQQARAAESGVAWVLPAAGPIPLTGLSHGTAGIALALLRLARLSGDGRFYETALGALAYERHHFSPGAGNWPDLREGKVDESERFRVGWCHGAPGIGLSRLAVLDLVSAEARGEIEEELEVALATTRREGFGENHSLCHGDLGNLELLLSLGLERSRPELLDESYRRAGAVLESIERDGWLLGLPIGLEPLGLMVGLAGVGYQLLRLAEPERVPSVLTLEPPVVA